METIYLSRRNLLVLLSKLDRVQEGDISFCSIIKQDNQNPKYPQSMPQVLVAAVEDSEYYIDRVPGQVHEKDETRIKL